MPTCGSNLGPIAGLAAGGKVVESAGWIGRGAVIGGGGMALPKPGSHGWEYLVGEGIPAGLGVTSGVGITSGGVAGGGVGGGTGGGGVKQ